MTQNLDPIARLLRSKSIGAQAIALSIMLTLFAPDVFRIIGDESLDVWGRLEQVAGALGQSMLAIVALAVDPKSIEGKES